MAEISFSALGSELATPDTLHDDDLFCVSDVSDTTDDPAGTSKKVKRSNLVGVGRHLIEEISGTLSEYDFDGIPGYYNRLILMARLQSTDTSAYPKQAYIYLNADTASTNYYYQDVRGTNGVNSYAFNNNKIIAVMGGAKLHPDSSDRYEYSQNEITIEGYASTDWVTVGRLKGINSSHSIQYQVNNLCEEKGFFWNSTAAISRIRITPVSNTVRGIARLYGEF